MKDVVEYFKTYFKNMKKLFLIFFIIFTIIGIFIVPSMIYASFNINEMSDPYDPTKNFSYINYLDLMKMSYSGTNPYSELFKIGKAEYYKDGNFKKGSRYIANYYKGYTIIYTLIFLYSIHLSIKKKGEYEGIEHGSSDWASQKEIYSKFDKKDGIILAKDIALPIDRGFGNKNVLVVGNTGSGKSAGFVKPNVKQNLGSYIFTDPKGELYDYSAEYFREQGYDIKVLNLKNPSKSDGYNPILNINSDTELDIIAHTVVNGQGGGATSDPYWTDNAKTLLRALIRFLMAVRPEEEQNLASCSNLVRMAASSGSFNVLSKLMKTLPKEHLARKDYESVELASDKAFSSICSTLQSVLTIFDSPEIAHLTSTNTIDFENIGRKKTALYVISPDTHSTYDFLLTIFFSQLIQQLYDDADSNGGQLEVPVFFFLDEFANIGQIPDFDRKIATARSRKMAFSVVLQSLEQLEAIYEESAETIIGNCDVHLFLGSTSAKTLEHFSKALGDKTIKVVGKDKKPKTVEGEENIGTSNQYIGRTLMTPDELRRLPSDECIIYTSGIKPIRKEKYLIFKYPEGKISEKYETNHNDYHVDRGEWNIFSVDSTNKQAEKKDVKNIFDTVDQPKTTDARKVGIEELNANQGDKEDKKDEKNNIVDINSIENNFNRNTQKIEESKLSPQMKKFFDVEEDEIYTPDLTEKEEKKQNITSDNPFDNNKYLNQKEAQNFEGVASQKDKTITEIFKEEIKKDKKEGNKSEEDSTGGVMEKIRLKEIDTDYDLERELEAKFDKLFNDLAEERDIS